MDNYLVKFSFGKIVFSINIVILLSVIGTSALSNLKACQSVRNVLEFFLLLVCIKGK